MRHSREMEEEGEFFPFGRPPASAWIAAGAVAFALFVLGGFIRTNRQLENLREESQREIRDLRAQMESLRGQGVPDAARRQLSRRVVPLPIASERKDEPGEGRPPAARPPPDPGRPTPPETAAAPAESPRSRPSYEFGRRSAEAAPNATPLQVLSVSQKRLMIDGGRNANLSGGARLELSRNGRWIGDLRITDVYDSMAVCEILHSTLPPRPGDTARLP
ncbi:MAG: hypothetical protein LBV15_06550 [Planctomycetota bacterium]|jgi:hypothetical protein|nr:hypothetical protein [Planctomycetota bacterium]